MTPKQQKALRKELQAIEKQEMRLEQAAHRSKPAPWKALLETKIPEKVYFSLEGAFCKGFQLVFSQGSAVIEKGLQRERLQADYAIRDYAVQIKGGRKELRQMRKSAWQTDLVNLAATTVEGIGLGALGIGMPDIVLFLGTLLKGIYETALNYGFDYTQEQEQMLILNMMATALSTGQAWTEGNKEVDAMLQLETLGISQEEIQTQINKTASVFAMDMLLLKFVQGLPIVGIVGGAANPIYYSKILKYVQLKYRKRYLLKKCWEQGTNWNPQKGEAL